MRLIRLLCWTACWLSCAASIGLADDGGRLRLLFLGDNGHHRPADRFAQLAPVLQQRGIDLKYTDEMSVLTPPTLADFDGLVLYANIDAIEPQRAQAVLDYVSGGGGFIPLHSASYCWRNSPQMVALMGAQFQRHGTGVVSTLAVNTMHPVMRGFGGFESWDETYVHFRHNKENRTLLEVRAGEPQGDGMSQEPWTWVRTQGKGRVFYTAWGHDERTWSHPGFHNLVERGIRWACGDDPAKAGVYTNTPDAGSGRREFPVPEMTAQRTDVAPFEYADVGAKIPNYPPSDKWGTQEDPFSKMQLPLPPEESIKHFVTPVGFEVRLFASEAPDGGDDSAGGTSRSIRERDPVKHQTDLEARSAAAGLGGKPIAMNWDERGRLWVCETVDYPNNLQPPGPDGTSPGHDRIRIVEDTDGDGIADRFTLFAENLSIPTAILPITGGAIVQNGTQTLFLKDTDGDGRADLRQVLISNWTLGDTHGGVSNFQYGLDNWIWAMQGYNTSSPVIGGEEQQSFRMGFFRFKLSPVSSVQRPATKSDARNPGHSTRNAGLEVTQLEFLRSTDNNTWGLGFSEEGVVFGSTANRNPSVYLPIPNRYYERVRGWSPSQLGSIADTHLFARPLSDKIRQVDHHGGYTAGAGHALYTARAFPQQWWNRTAFVCGPTGKLVGTFVISADGADFHSTSPFNLLASDDEWSAPIMAEVGPDGAVWVIDWYNYIVQHNPTPQGFETGKGNAFESDLRDKQHGRIYRIVYTGAGERGTSVPRWSRSPARGADQEADAIRSPADLVESLRHPTMLWRKQAQRLLVERGKTDVVPQLIALVEDESVDEIGLNVGAIHALWTLHGLGALDNAGSPAAKAAAGALQHPSAGVRRNAVQVLPPDALTVRVIAGLLDDADAQVRLAAILAIADMETSPAAGRKVAALVRSSDDTPDPWIADALTSAAAAHALPFLTELARPPARESQAEQNPASALAGERALSIASIVAEHIARGRPSTGEMDELVSALVAADPPLGAAVLGGLSAGWQRGYSIDLPDEADEKLISLLERMSAGAKGQLIGLAANWGSSALQQHAAGIADALLATVEEARTPISERVAAARQLVGFRGRDSKIVEKLLGEIGPQTPPELARGLIDAVALSRADDVGPQIIQRTPSMTPASRDAALGALLQRPETTSALLDAIQQDRLQLSDLSLEQQRLLTNHPDRRIRRQAEKLLSQGGGLPDPDRDKVLQQLLPLAEQQGDATLGKTMFVKHCAKCHQHASVEVASIPEAQSLRDAPAGNIGPNLTGMAVHPKAELLTHIIDPGRSVEGNFRSYTVVTTDGQVLTGMLASETRTSIELIDTNAKHQALPREDIEELVASRKSVMPDGFEKQMTSEELSGLLAFLTQRGRYLPLDLRKAATIVSTKPMFYGQTPAERLVFEDWGLKTVGEVPFLLVDPQQDRQPNVILLYGPNGRFPPQMPRSVALPVNAPAGAIHLLGGIGGWSFPAHQATSTSMIVRLHYEDGQTENHELKNGVHFADYIRRVDVPGSEFAFDLQGRQVRYLKIGVERPTQPIREIEFLKGDDPTAPIVMAVTVEAPAS